MNQIAVPIGLFNYDYSNYELVMIVRPWIGKKEYFQRYLNNQYVLPNVFSF
jgi:hypothetical protein